MQAWTTPRESLDSPRRKLGLTHPITSHGGSHRGYSPRPSLDSPQTKRGGTEILARIPGETVDVSAKDRRCLSERPSMSQREIGDVSGRHRRGFPPPPGERSGGGSQRPQGEPSGMGEDHGGHPFPHTAGGGGKLGWGQGKVGDFCKFAATNQGRGKREWH